MAMTMLFVLVLLPCMLLRNLHHFQNDGVIGPIAMVVSSVQFTKKVLSFFASCPFPVPSRYILQHQALSKVKPHVPKTILFTLKLKGGLGLPNFTKYYQEAQQAQLPKYHAVHEIPLWVALESMDCNPLSYLSQLCRGNCWTLQNPIILLLDSLKSHYSLQSPHNPIVIPAQSGLLLCLDFYFFSNMVFCQLLLGL